MTPKEYLSQAYRIEQRIKRKRERLMSIRECSTDVSVSYSDMPHGGTANVHQMEDAILKAVQLENEIHEDTILLADVREDIRKLIGQVHNERYREVLEKRYLCCLSWGQITDELHCSMACVLKRHREALNAIDCLLREREGTA